MLMTLRVRRVHVHYTHSGGAAFGVLLHSPSTCESALLAADGVALGASSDVGGVYACSGYFGILNLGQECVSYI